MKRKPQTRHKTEDIQKAVARIQGGESLSVVAKELGVSKSLASYWLDRADRYLPAEASAPVSGKQMMRTRRFVEQCAVAIALAFDRLKIELRKDAPKGVKDLGLLIAVLFDKQVQAAQKSEAPAQQDDQDWTDSEDTLLILRQHRSGKPGDTPEKTTAKPGEGASGLEQQNRAALPGPDAARIARNDVEEAQVIEKKSN